MATLFWTLLVPLISTADEVDFTCRKSSGHVSRYWRTRGLSAGFTCNSENKKKALNVSNLSYKKKFLASANYLLITTYKKTSFTSCITMFFQGIDYAVIIYIHILNMK